MSGSVVIYEPADGLRLAPPTQDEARAIAGWRYQPPYDVYDLSPERASTRNGRAVSAARSADFVPAGVHENERGPYVLLIRSLTTTWESPEGDSNS
jgi:hypothetical protein